MDIEYWPTNSLPALWSNKGFLFIQRRFKEEWGITRTDVTPASIISRDNFILIDQGKLVGWLGLEKAGEFTNACIEKSLHGTQLLKFFIYRTLDLIPPDTYFAYVPIARTASARAFLSCGFRIGEFPIHKRLSYPEGGIEVVRLVREADSSMLLDIEETQNELNRIRRLANGNTNQIYRYIR